MKALVTNKLLLLLCRWYYEKFQRASYKPAQAQQRLLLSLLRRNRNTEFGKKYGFRSIKNIKDYQLKVPLTNYTFYEKYIKQIFNGKNRVLTEDNVKLFQPTSGSAAPAKYIPYTPSLKQEFMRGVLPWIYNLYTHYPRLQHGLAYWSITPIGKNKDKMNDKIPTGFEEDASYFGMLQQFLLRHLIPIPKEVAMIPDFDAFRYVTLLFLLREKNLRLISVWNPTFLTILFEPLNEWLDFLADDIKKGTIASWVTLPKNIRRMLQRKLSANPHRAADLRRPIILTSLFSKLCLISCWADSNAAAYIKSVRRLFPGVPIQKKGLLATEGVVSFPIVEAQEPVLSIRSHFYEFIELKSGTIKLAHELEIGEKYSVVITTGGGLYRYRLNDITQVTGFYRHLPLLRFLGKEDFVSDLFGEKFYEQHVAFAIKKASQIIKSHPKFILLAPEKFSDFKAAYVLYVECSTSLNDKILGKLLGSVEKELLRNPNYRYCRKLGQLGPLMLFRISKAGMKTYLQTQCKRGKRLGDIKPAVLDKGTGWSGVFKGHFL